MSAPAYRDRPAEPVGAEDLLSRLSRVRRGGDGRWMASCPCGVHANGDRSRGLSIRLGDDGRILLNCFGGCSFAEIVAALGLDARQLFPANDRPWTPARPAMDPDREAKALLERLRHLRAPPPPERMTAELRLVGALLAGGSKALRDLPAGFRPARDLRCFPLRLIVQAVEDLAAQGTPRRWFSPLALVREIERVGGRGYAPEVFFLSRLAVRTARSAT
jgi:hypothetical protein